MRTPPTVPMPMPEATHACVDGGDAPWRAGCLGAVREALDDAQAVLAFLRAGMRTRAIDPGETLWIIDLAPGDGERAWRVLRAIRSQAPRAPAIRYLAGCLDTAHRERLTLHPCLAPLVTDGTLCLDAQGTALPSHPLRNPPVVLAHGAFRTRGQTCHMFRAGELMTSVPCVDVNPIWRPADRRDGLSRLAMGCRDMPDGATFTLPSGVMRILADLLHWSGGRLLLRGSDEDLHAPAGGTHLETASTVLRLDAMVRWHHAHGASVHQLRRDEGGRVLHLALHAPDAPALRDCLPDLLALPHPDDHVDVLRALHTVARPTPAQCRALLRATADDPRAFAILASYWPEAGRMSPTDEWWAVRADTASNAADNIPYQIESPGDSDE